jgi:hypothetical protein
MRTHRRGQRYALGQQVYIRGWGVLDTATVTAAITVRGWPYYEVIAAADASVWLVPRLHCSTIPLPVL